MAFTTLDETELKAVSGGISMKLTQYGYRNDPYMDSDTLHGRGAYRHLSKDTSVALTDSGLRALGLTRSQVRHKDYWVEINLGKKGGGVLRRRIDDRAPEHDKRVDLYQLQGFNRHLPDRADVRLV